MLQDCYKVSGSLRRAVPPVLLIMLEHVHKILRLVSVVS